MRAKKTIERLALLTALLAPAACGEGDGAGSQSENVRANDYQFVEAKQWEIVDALGVALTSTALTNRDDSYNDDAPYGDSITQKAVLFTFRRYLASMHSWVDEAGLLGGIDVQYTDDPPNPGPDFSPCADEIGFGCDDGDDKCITAVVPCTLQKISQDDQEPRKVLDVVLPDYITIDVTETPGFPNGRPIYKIGPNGELIYEQINDLVIAMGFLEMGGECSADPTGICSVRTFSDMKNPDGSRGMNKQENDVEFNREFPYLAGPHGVAPEDGYWPEPGYDG